MKPHVLKWDGRVLDLSGPTKIMGIINVTPDSFSDGGLFFDPQKAVDHGLEMAAAGAHVLDIGGESTRPFSDPVTEKEELDRVIPVIAKLAGQVDVPISIDTSKAKVAREAVAAGASIINDVSALMADPAMAETAAAAGVPVILMHMAGTPKTMQSAPYYEDVVADVAAYLDKAATRAMEAGISRDKIILDPGIGFGKTVLHNLQLIQNLDALDELAYPLLLGHSRKSFIKKILAGKMGRDPDAEEVILGTQAVTMAGALAGVHLVRVHDVPQAVVTLELARALSQA